MNPLFPFSLTFSHTESEGYCLDARNPHIFPLSKQTAGWFLLGSLARVSTFAITPLLPRLPRRRLSLFRSLRTKT